jgi:hypothetical protein
MRFISPQFKNTRHNAGLMGKASKIGSHVYNAEDILTELLQSLPGADQSG